MLSKHDFSREIYVLSTRIQYQKMIFWLKGKDTSCSAMLVQAGLISLLVGTRTLHENRCPHFRLVSWTMCLPTRTNSVPGGHFWLNEPMAFSLHTFSSVVGSDLDTVSSRKMAAGGI